MALALTEDHRALAAVARSFVEERGVLDAARATLAKGEERLPPFWSELAALGWLGLHVAEEYGGQGYGLAELAIVVEELGRAVAPGPFLPTVTAAAVIAEAGSDALRAELLPSLVDGSRVAVVGLEPAPGTEGPAPGTEGTVVAGGGLAQTFLVPRRCRRRRPRRLRPIGGERHTLRVARPNPTLGGGGDHRSARRGHRRRCRRRDACRPRAGGRRGCGWRAGVPRRRRRVRARPRAVRPGHRVLPGDQAPLRGDAGRRRDGRRGRVGCRPQRGPRRARSSTRGCSRGLHGAPRVPASRRDEHPDPRRYRVHVGARRAPVPAARRGARGRRRRVGRGRRRDAAHARRRRAPPRSGAAPRGRGVPRRGPRVPGPPRRAARRRPPRRAHRVRVLRPALARAVGPWGRCGRAARDRRRARRRRAAPTRHRRLGSAHARAAGPARPGGAMGASEPRGRDAVVPAVQRTERRLGRRRDRDAARRGRTAGGSSTARRCGPAAPRARRWDWRRCAPTPTRRSTRASRRWRST